MYDVTIRKKAESEVASIPCIFISSYVFFFKVNFNFFSTSQLDLIKAHLKFSDK